MKTSDCGDDAIDSTAKSGVPVNTSHADENDAPSPWFVQLTDSGREEVMLCLPYAGTGNSVFGGWRTSKFDSADIVVLQLPGRDARLREKPIGSAPELVEKLADAILESPLIERPLTLLGCSVGGVIAFELARELRRRKIYIERLIVGACRGPHRLAVKVPVACLPDDEMVDKLRNWYGAIPPEIADNPAVLELVLPAIRADMNVYETHQYRDDEPLQCPITAMGGSEDRIVTINDLNGWRQHTTKKFTCRQFSGGHFFMKSNCAPVLRFIDRQMRS